MQTDPKRRDFLRHGSSALAATWLGTQWPAVLQAAAQAAEARAAGAPLTHLAPGEALDLAAIAERILPATDTPGATDLGVIHFVDMALDGFAAGMERLLRPALGALNRTVTERHTAEYFHQLAPPLQDAMLREIEGDAFFQTMRMLTLAGAFALPARGGNRAGLGWALLGFDARHVWRPPFGHYDAPWHAGEGSAEDMPAMPPSSHGPSGREPATGRQRNPRALPGTGDREGGPHG